MAEGGKDRESGVDADLDGPDTACATPAATTLLGVAAPLSTYWQLTPETNGLAGGIASPSMVAFDDFDASFTYSITYSSGTNPGAGLAFFVIAAPVNDLQCQSGPNLCTLGRNPVIPGPVAGFAVILRTSKLVAGDPEVPYIAVVDSQAFPGTQPSSTVLLESSTVYSLVGSPGGGVVPPPNTFHTMAISVRAGKISAAIDGNKLLNGTPIPNWAPGRVSTWGIGSATGQGSTFAERTVVGQMSVNRCPPP